LPGQADYPGNIFWINFQRRSLFGAQVGIHYRQSGRVTPAANEARFAGCFDQYQSRSSYPETLTGFYEIIVQIVLLGDPKLALLALDVLAAQVAFDAPYPSFVQENVWRGEM
jgi:hypothetical protein